jgi:hypothetical protein
MKAIKLLLGLIIGIATVTLAQEADSIIVTYDNQHTVIPVPDFGKQTSIKMADSVQMIEIGVSRRKLSDISSAVQIPANTVAVEKTLKKIKWYSQVEAGYTLRFFTGVSSESVVVNSESYTLYYNTDNISGYKLGVSIFEKERYFTDKFSYVSGFKIGFAQSFRKNKDIPVVQDTLARGFVGFNPVTTTSLQFLFPFGFRHYIVKDKWNVRINYGSNIGFSIDFLKQPGSKIVMEFSGSPLLLQPFLGFETGKWGLLTYANLSFGSKYDFTLHNTGLSIDYGIGFLLTYRLF